MEKSESKAKGKEQPKSVAISRRSITLDAPIVTSEIVDGCLYTGLFGLLDSLRFKKVSDEILRIAEMRDYESIIIDLSNIDIIDSTIANQFKKLNRLLQLIGLDVVFCGLKPIVAKSMISAGIELNTITVKKNLKTALKTVLNDQGLAILPKNSD